eukprot:gb/GECH01010518.1/.p1 GENE.gb/GECH01010518.1/~~gb/GECH01010518.1/.p1  ORF type:complete len:170 (+),score=14.10 gb/GECH01010518.1/:1-510(+)
MDIFPYIFYNTLNISNYQYQQNQSQQTLTGVHLKSCQYNSGFCIDVLKFRVPILNVELFHFLVLLPPSLFIFFLISKLRLSARVLRSQRSTLLHLYYTFVWIVCVFTFLGLVITFLVTSSSIFSSEATTIVGEIGIRVISFIINMIEVCYHHYSYSYFLIIYIIPHFSF